VWHAVESRIAPDDTTGTLFDRLATLGANALVDTLPRIAEGAAPTPQDASLVTLAPKIDRESARIRWDATTREVSCRIRSMDPFPGGWTLLGHEPMKVFGPLDGLAHAPPHAPVGSIIATQTELRVSCADGLITIGEVQPAGRRRMPAAEWLRGAPLTTTSRFT
jgi:methionyl-tRNA formyltransferase